MIYWLNTLTEKDADEVGMDSVNIGRIFSTNVSVPIGFVVPSSTYNSFIGGLGIGPILDSLDVDTVDLKFVSNKIQLMIMKSELKNEDEIVDAYDTLSADRLAKKDNLVSLRISPVAYDRAVVALLDTYFSGVKGADEVINHVKACYASVFSAKNLYYLKKHGFDWKKISLPIIVQVAVDASASGVAYSRNPSSSADEIVIEAVFGLENGLNLTSPDVYVVDKFSDGIKQVIIGNKVLMFVRDPATGLAVKQSLSESKMRQQVLDAHLIVEISDLTKRIERLFKHPQKVRWAFEREKFYVISSAPMK